MSLIKSISGIRGTIGGAPGEGLSPLDIVKFTAAYATFIRRNTTRTSNVIVVGRDARLSGEMVSGIVVSTLCGMGFDVVNIGLASTPTTEVAVVAENACGGIIITASSLPHTTPASGTPSSSSMSRENSLMTHKVRRFLPLLPTIPTVSLT